MEKPGWREAAGSPPGWEGRPSEEGVVVMEVRRGVEEEEEEKEGERWILDRA